MKELLQLFNQQEVAYAICGGFAVAHHGFVRMTLDLDLLIDPDPENAERAFVALSKFGFGQAGFTVEDLQRSDTAITLGEQPNQIDLLTRMSSAPASVVVSNADLSEMDGIQVRVVNKRDLIIAKQEANRTKDRIDIEELNRV
jgi:predicted nucleotidyltransferase